MLDGIDEVDWAGLDHAFKGSVYVPDLLRSLAGPEADEAIEELYSTILHQGTIYPATAAAVPWLVDLARHSPYARDEVLWLLGAAVDLDQADGPAVRAAIERDFPALLELLDDSSADVRAAVVYPLARAGVPASAFLSRWAVEQDAQVRTSLVFALGEVWVSSAGPVLAGVVGRAEPALTLAAAVAMMRAGQQWPSGTVAALVEAIDAEPDLPYWWMKGGLEGELLVPLAADAAAGLFAPMLRSSRPSTRQAALDAIGQRSLERRSEPARFMPMAGAALTDPDPGVRRSALRALARGGEAAGSFADGLAGLLGQEPTSREIRRDQYEARATLMRLGDPRWVDAACMPGARQFRIDVTKARFTTAALNAVVDRLRAEPARADVLAAVIAHWGVTEAVRDLVAAMPYAGIAVTEALLVLGHDDPSTVPHLRTLAGNGDLPAAAALWRLTGDAAPVLTVVRTMLSTHHYTLPRSVVAIGTLGPALRSLLPTAEALLTTTAPDSTQLLAAWIVTAAGDWQQTVPTLRATLTAGGPPATEAAELIADHAPHPALADLEPALRRRLGDWGTRVPAARALARLGVPASDLAVPLVDGISDDGRTDALTVLTELRTIEAIPALEALTAQDERLDATNVIPDRVWADETLRERVLHTIEILRAG